MKTEAEEVLEPIKEMNLAVSITGMTITKVSLIG